MLHLFAGPNDPDDALSKVSDFYEKHSEKDIIMQNFPGLPFGAVHCFLNSNKALKDFFPREFETKRDFDRGLVPISSKGFPNLSGKEGLANRAVFSEFFLYDNIQTLYDPMNKILETNTAEFIKNNKITETEYCSVDLKEFVQKVVLDWITLLIFGYDSASELNIDINKYPELKKIELFNQRFGEKRQANIIQIIILFVEATALIMMDPLNSMAFGWPYLFQVKQLYRDRKNIQIFMDKIVLEQYHKRFK